MALQFRNGTLLRFCSYTRFLSKLLPHPLFLYNAHLASNGSSKRSDEAIMHLKFVYDTLMCWCVSPLSIDQNGTTLLVGLCTIVRGDNNNEVLLVSWYWYIFSLHSMRGVHVVCWAVTPQTVIGCVGRWDRIAVAIPTLLIYQPTNPVVKFASPVAGTSRI
jgi:hypothetical protein